MGNVSKRLTLHFLACFGVIATLWAFWWGFVVSGFFGFSALLDPAFPYHVLPAIILDAAALAYWVWSHRSQP